MIRDLMQSVKSFLTEKQAIAQKERQLIEDLNRVLPQIGYRVVPASEDTAKTSAAVPVMPAAVAPARDRNGSSGRKPLACPHCDRRFARPLHLGRHISASHARKKRAA